MAEGEDGGWWRSWLQQSLQTVKEKSTEALEFMKQDLTEFTQVVQHDTAGTIAATASVVKEKLATENSSGATEKLRKGLSNFLGVISDTFAPSPDKTIDCDVITLMATPSGTTELYDSAKARLYSLQSDPATYCNESDGPSQLFEAWLSHFNQEFLGSSSSLQPHTQPPHEANPAPALTTEVTPTLEVSMESWATLSPTPAEATPSESSESVSLMTQVTNPGSAAATAPALPTQTDAQLSRAGHLSPRLQKVPREDSKTAEPTQPTSMPQDGKPSPEKQPKEVTESKGQNQPDSPREEGPMDLQLFKLNSDSGKSTPSNNGKKGSSTDVSEDWEKDFDLDMTEEEVQLALSKADITGELDDEEWADWE
ncbi:BSD domain-containing protein 1-like [Anolis sagrei]|uniref:BSD domain-containing protein 1-like n=1 Tax=Anolis sagrei TaxID=38937 RepID=UPI003522ACAC